MQLTRLHLFNNMKLQDWDDNTFPDRLMPGVIIRRSCEDIFINFRGSVYATPTANRFSSSSFNGASD